MIRLTFRRLVSDKRRAVGSGIAVLLGVAFLAGTLTFGDTLSRSFDLVYERHNAGTDLVVRNATRIDAGDDSAVRGPTEASLVERIEPLPGVAAVAVEVDGIAQLTGSDGAAIGGGGPPTVGTNWIADRRLNPWTLVRGRAPHGPTEVVIDSESAAHGGLTVGARTTLRTPEPRPVTIVGVARLGDLPTIAGATYTWVDTATARAWFARPGEVSAIRIHAAEGADPARLRTVVDRVVDAPSEVITGDELTREQRADLDGDFLGLLRTALVAFAGVALVVSAFSIHNTFTILVAHRSRESALLRALGASRRQVLVGAAVESITVGAIAAAAGVVLGIGLAYGLRVFLAGHGLEVAIPGVVVGARTVLTAFGLGVAVATVSTIVPAVRSSAAPPLAAVRSLAVEPSLAGRRRVVLGILSTGLGVVGVAGAGSSMSRLGLGGLGCLVGAIALGPVLVRPVAAALAWPLARVGTSARLAQRNVGRNPRRTSASATALLVGVTVVTLFTTVAASVKASMVDVIGTSFGGDLVLAADFGTPGLSPEVAATSARLPEVRRVAALAPAVATIAGRPESFAATDLAHLDGLVDLDVQAGSLTGAAPDAIAVSRDYADRHHLSLGSTIDVAFADGGDRRLPVGVVYAEDALMGPIIFPIQVWRPHATTSVHNVVLYDLAPGVSLRDGQAAVQAVANRYGAPHVQTSDEFLATAAGQVDQALIVIYGLLGLAVLIALMGIANTLSLAVHERTRELGLLRAIGQTRRQLRATVRVESVVTALLGTLGGLVLGGFLGWGVMGALSESVGFDVVALPVRPLVVVVVLSALAGVVASVLPARRAARLDILTAVAAA